DDGKHAFRLGAVAHVREHPRAHLGRVAGVPVLQQGGREVHGANGEPGSDRTLHLAAPLGHEQPRPPAVSRAPQAEHLLHARIVDRRDHSLGGPRPVSDTETHRQQKCHKSRTGRCEDRSTSVPSMTWDTHGETNGPARITTSGHAGTTSGRSTATTGRGSSSWFGSASSSAVTTGH